MAHMQLGVVLRKGAAHKTLRPHVMQKPGQAAVPLAHAVNLNHPHVAACQQGHARKRAGTPPSIDPHDRHFTPHALYMARQHIALRPCRPYFLHLARLDQRGQRARDAGLAGV